MSDYRYDVVIVGAGPAGMGCAIPLQKQNASLCVIDRATFPRNKTCAGLVTAKTYRLITSLLDGGSDALYCCTADEVRLFRKTELLVSAPLERPVRLVNRCTFDNALVETYQRLGGVLREGESGIKIDCENNCITMKNGDTIRYGHLLFADGALSMAHHRLNIDRRKLAFGVEVYLPSEKLGIQSVDLYFGYLKSGYAWVFPHGDTVCVGLADLYNKKTDYRKLLTAFLADLGVSAEGEKVIGAFLPYGEVIPQDQLPDNVMLLGDAGGFTDPISGEGLYMALQTGVYAAQALAQEHPKQAYSDSIKPLVRIVNDGKKVQKTFYSPMIQKLFTSKVKGKSGLVAYFFDQMVEEYRYEYRDIHHLYSGYHDADKEQT